MRDETRQRLYASYVSTHAGPANQRANDLAFERDIAPHLPAGKDLRVIDLGCGQGLLVEAFHRHGHLGARGIDVSPEQVALAHSRGLSAVRLGDYRDSLGPEAYDVVTATDFLEHLTYDEVLETLDRVHEALGPEGVFVSRVPNMTSPFAGNYRYGDVTHESSFTARSMRQLASAAGFSSCTAYACGPSAVGFKSAMRVVLWKIASAGMKAALAAETGQVRGHLVTQNMVAVMRK